MIVESVPCYARVNEVVPVREGVIIYNVHFRSWNAMVGMESQHHMAVAPPTHVWANIIVHAAQAW